MAWDREQSPFALWTLYRVKTGLLWYAPLQDETFDSGASVDMEILVDSNSEIWPLSGTIVGAGGPCTGDTGCLTRASSSTSAYLNTDSSSMPIPQALTFAYWYRRNPASASGYTSYIGVKMDTDGDSGFGLNVTRPGENGKAEFQTYYDAGPPEERRIASQPDDALPEIGDSEWHWLVGTFDPTSNMSFLYVDGIQVASTDEGNFIQASSGKLTNSVVDSQLLEYAHMAMWNRVLTPEEISEGFSAASTPFYHAPDLWISESFGTRPPYKYPIDTWNVLYYPESTYYTTGADAQLVSFSGNRVLEYYINYSGPAYSYAQSTLRAPLDLTDPDKRAIKVRIQAIDSSTSRGRIQWHFSPKPLWYSWDTREQYDLYPSNDLYPGDYLFPIDYVDEPTAAIAVEIESGTATFYRMIHANLMETLWVVSITPNSFNNYWIELRADGLARLAVNNTVKQLSSPIIPTSTELYTTIECFTRSTSNPCVRLQEILAMQSIPTAPTGVTAEVVSRNAIQYNADPNPIDDLVFAYRYEVVDTPYSYENPTTKQFGDILPQGEYALRAMSRNQSPFSES